MEKVAVEANTHDFEDETKEIKISIEGYSDMPFWNHDLKIKAAMALLNMVDRKDFAEYNKDEEFFKYIKELRELIDAIEM